MTSPVQSRWIPIAADDGGQYEAMLSLPPAGRGPGLVLFQEIFGVNRHIQAVAEQYALAGFVVLTPDVFWRQAPRVELGYEGADRERALQLMQGADRAALARDILTSVAALRQRPELRGGIGAFGYCMGGRLAYQAAATAGVDAAVAYYGGGIQDQLDLVSGIRCPIQLHYGETDTHIPLAAVERVRAALGARAEVHVHAGAGHGFNCWDRASYHPAAAARAFASALTLFSATLFTDPHLTITT